MCFGQNVEEWVLGRTANSSNYMAPGSASPHAGTCSLNFLAPDVRRLFSQARLDLGLYHTVAALFRLCYPYPTSGPKGLARSTSREKRNRKENISDPWYLHRGSNRERFRTYVFFFWSSKSVQQSVSGSSNFISFHLPVCFYPVCLVYSLFSHLRMPVYWLCKAALETAEWTEFLN